MDQLEVTRKYGYQMTHTMIGSTPNNAQYYGIIWNITHPVEIMRVFVSFGTSSTSGTLQLEKLTGTQASGAGTNIFKSAFSTSGTANTVVEKKGIDMASDRQFRTGDRLGLVNGGTLTSLTNLVITIYYKPLARGEYST